MSHLFYSAILTLIVLPLSAFYCGNPEIDLPYEGPMTSKESWMTLKTGYLGTDVFNRKLAGAKTFHFWANGGVMSFDFLEKLSISGYLAAVRMKAKHKNDRYLTETALGGGLGIQAVLLRKRHFTFGVNAKYFQTAADVDSSIGGSILYREGQLGLAVSYDFKELFPYAGIKYSKAAASFSKPKSYTLKSQNPVGVFIGLTLCAPTTISLTAEADFIDEQGISLSLSIRL